MNIALMKRLSFSHLPDDVRVEMICMLFQSRPAWTMLLSGIGAALCIALGVRTPFAIFLSALVCVASSARAGVLLAFPRERIKSLDLREATTWSNRLGACLVAVGLLMGLVNMEGLSAGGDLAIVSFGWAMAASVGVTSRNSTVPWIATSFVFAVMTPTVIAAFMNPEEVIRIAGLFAIGATAFALDAAKSLHQTFAERILARHELAERAAHDDLTDLLNRSAFTERLISSLNVERADDRSALLCLDLDGFKGVNDAHGHLAGDDLLRQVADRLRTALRRGDIACRLGGDEFAVALRPGTSEHEAVELADLLIEKIGAPYMLEGKSIAAVGVSIGLAFKPRDGHDPRHLLRSADAALYRAKAAGKGCWMLARPPALAA